MPSLFGLKFCTPGLVLISLNKHKEDNKLEQDHSAHYGSFGRIFMFKIPFYFILYQYTPGIVDGQSMEN